MPSKFGYLLIFACVVNIFNLANELTFQNFLFLVAIGLLPLLEIYDEKWNINNDNILSKLMSLSIVSKFMFFVISFSICYSIAFNQFGFNDLALIVIPTIIIIGEYKYGKNIKFLQDYTSTNAHVANNEIVLNPTFNSGSLPIKLRKNEFIILSEFVVLNEKRSHYVHGSRKYKISGYNETLWTVQGRGHLIITNQRMLYQGNNKREYKLEEIYKIQTWIKKKGLFIQKKIPSGIVIDSSKYARQHMYESIHPYFWIKAFQEKSNIEQQVYAQLHQQQEYQYTVNNPVMTNKTGYECSHCGSIVNTKFCTSCGIERIDNSSRPDWQTMDGKQFEEFMTILFELMGYEQVINRVHVGDGGIDIEAFEHGLLTSSKIGIECKNWFSKPVGREVIQKLDSALKYENFTKGIVVTTGRFSQDAIEYAKNVKIFLIDGNQLNNLVDKHFLKK